jgi:hypothetical protein
VANTAANRRLTFALCGRSGRRRHYASALVLAMLPLVATLAAVELVHGTAAQLVALTVVNGVASLVRFAVLRSWVFG